MIFIGKKNSDEITTLVSELSPYAVLSASLLYVAAVCFSLSNIFIRYPLSAIFVLLYAFFQFLVYERINIATDRIVPVEISKWIRRFTVFGVLVIFEIVITSMMIFALTAIK